jgi:hypothetical protein
VKGIVSVSHQSLIPIILGIRRRDLKSKGLGGLGRKLYLLFYYKRVWCWWLVEVAGVLVGDNTGRGLCFCLG